MEGVDAKVAWHCCYGNAGGNRLAGLFPAGFRDHHGEVGVYFEAAAVIVVLVLLGQILELAARERTGSAIRVAPRLLSSANWP